VPALILKASCLQLAFFVDFLQEYVISLKTSPFPQKVDT